MELKASGANPEPREQAFCNSGFSRLIDKSVDKVHCDVRHKCFIYFLQSSGQSVRKVDIPAKQKRYS